MSDFLKIDQRSITTILVIMTIGCIRTQAEEGPNDSGQIITKSLWFFDPSSQHMEFYIYNIEYDPEDHDFYYLGLRRDSNRFITKGDLLGNIKWHKVYSNITVLLSLMYSSNNKLLYHTLDTGNTFALVNISSQDGNILNSLSQTDFIQYFYSHMCSLSSDESAIFGTGVTASRDNSVLIRLDISQRKFEVCIIQISRLSFLEIISLSTKEALISFYSNYEYHFIKATFIA